MRAADAEDPPAGRGRLGVASVAPMANLCGVGVRRQWRRLMRGQPERRKECAQVVDREGAAAAAPARLSVGCCAVLVWLS